MGKARRWNVVFAPLVGKKLHLRIIELIPKPIDNAQAVVMDDRIGMTRYCQREDVELQLLTREGCVCGGFSRSWH
jgi:hypothetical protein